MTFEPCRKCSCTGIFIDYVRKSWITSHEDYGGLELFVNYCSCEYGIQRKKQDVIMDAPGWVNPLSLLSDDEILATIKDEEMHGKVEEN
jgi:hypothetical protein